MYQITKAKKLADKIYLMDVVAPRVAANCLPGQFIIAKVDKEGERIPLTICDYDREKGTITIVFQIVGASTEKMSKLVEGDSFTDFVGPLGVASEFTKEDPEALKNKKFLFVAGGVGAAPVYPQVKWLHEHGIQADVIVGAKTQSLILLEEEMKAVGNVYITTDDGSYERKGMVTQVIQDDEIRMQADKGAWYSNNRKLKPDHGRRNRYVRRMSCICRRRNQVCLCRWTRV